MFDVLACALINLFRMYLIYRFVLTFLGKSEVSKKKEFLAYAGFYIVNTVLFLEFRTVWINVLSNVIGIGIIVWLHSKSIRTILFITASIYLINMGCDVAGTALFINYKDGVVHSQVYAALAVFLIFVCELITERIITVHKNTDMTRNLSLIVVPLCSITIVCFLTYSDTCTDVGVAIVSIGLVVVNFFMFYLYNQLLYSIIQRYETEMLRQKVQIYSNQLNAVLQSEERVKALKHDMKHHMNEIKLLANKYGAVEIQNYIERMEVFIQNPKEMVSSGNLEIDSVLNYILQRAEEELKNVNTKVILPEKMKHSFDIIILLGNLLDNAIEAAKQTDEKYLGVDIILKKGVLKIKIENSFLPTSIARGEQRGERRFI